MSITYPVTLPDVPDDRWNGESTPDTTTYHQSYALTHFAIDAATPHEAELRVLAWIDHSYEDDLRGATATAINRIGPTRWNVQLKILGEYGDG